MPWWKFWDKRKSTVLDVSSAAGLPLYLLVEKAEPFSFLFDDEAFSSWCPRKIEFTDDTVMWMRVATAGYQLAIYLKLIERKFGAEIARIAREHLLIKADRLPDLQIRQLLVLMEDSVAKAETTADKSEEAPEETTDVPFEYYIALAALVFTPGAPRYVSPDTWKEAGLTGSPSPDTLMPTDGIDDVFTTLLMNAKQVALREFEPLVAQLNLDPASIKTLVRSMPSMPSRVLRTHDTVAWSVHPGCFERQLQRRRHNLLFPPDMRTPTFQEIAKAKVQDRKECQEFMHDFRGVVTDIMMGDDLVAYSQADKYRGRIEELIERASLLSKTENSLN